MNLPPTEPIVVHCVFHGILLLLLKGLYLALNVFMTSQACEWAVLTVLAWCIIDDASLRGCRRDAEAGLASLIAKCDASLASISDLAMRYESIDRRCQAANLRHLRARDATLRQLNWMAFCRRCILLEHLRIIRGDVQEPEPSARPANATMQRSASDGDMFAGPLPRLHSLT